MIGQNTVIGWVNQYYEGFSYTILSINSGIDESIIRENVEGFMGKYPRPEWAIQQIFRMSGLLENVDSIGVGHPSEEFVKKNGWDESWLIHGCHDNICCGEGDNE